MVLASGLEADMVLGTMGPGHGIATIEKIATAAVMAATTSVRWAMVASVAMSTLA